MGIGEPDDVVLVDDHDGRIREVPPPVTENGRDVGPLPRPFLLLIGSGREGDSQRPDQARVRVGGDREGEVQPPFDGDQALGDLRADSDQVSAELVQFGRQGVPVGGQRGVAGRAVLEAEEDQHGGTGAHQVGQGDRAAVHLVQGKRGHDVAGLDYSRPVRLVLQALPVGQVLGEVLRRPVKVSLGLKGVEILLHRVALAAGMLVGLSHGGLLVIVSGSGLRASRHRRPQTHAISL